MWVLEDQKYQSMGSCTLPCSYKEQRIGTEFYVVETDNRTVLSLKTCKQLNLIKVMYSVRFGDEVSGCSTEQVKENYRDVFEGLGKLNEAKLGKLGYTIL